MISRTRHFFPVLAFLAAAFLYAPLRAQAQTTSSQSSTSAHGERWLHVRVISTNAKGETVRVNVPLELAEKVLPAIDHDRLHNGKVRVGCMDCDGVDVRTIFEAVRSSKDGEFVTVQSNDADISVMKKEGMLYVHVHEKNKPKHSQVEVKVPMKVVEALLSGSKDELDIAAGLHALASQGDVELVSVKDDENTIRVWLDSKNVTTD
jgi:invasion protein IalB